MTYVLVSLVGEKDGATADADLLAGHLEKHTHPKAIHRGHCPDRDSIRDDAVSCGAVGVLFGHDGSGSLRAVSDTKYPWADGAQLARMFPSGRLYVFACETTKDDMADSLGRQALESGVQVFVGHAAKISAPDSDLSSRPEYDPICRCSHAMIRAFLDGCDDGGELQAAGWQAHNILENGIGLTEDPLGLNFWKTSVPIQQLVSSLRVLKQEAREPGSNDSLLK